jgi:3-methyladenine DNA glycosylase/8-oxoguanine DNA glycosylase
MVLIFCLRRPDVLPVEDLGVRVGLQRLDQLSELPKPADVQRRAEIWRPWRTVASWYCWQLLRLPR